METSTGVEVCETHEAVELDVEEVAAEEDVAADKATRQYPSKNNETHEIPESLHCWIMALSAQQINTYMGFTEEQKPDQQILIETRASTRGCGSDCEKGTWRLAACTDPHSTKRQIRLIRAALAPEQRKERAMS